MFKLIVAAMLIVSFAYGADYERSEDGSFVSLRTSNSLSKLPRASTIQLIVSKSVEELMQSHAKSAQDILKLIKQTSGYIKERNDETLNKIVDYTKAAPLFETIQIMQQAKDCSVNRSSKVTVVLPITVLPDHLIPEKIRRQTLTMINLIATHGKNGVEYEWLYILSEQHVWTIKIYSTIKNKYCFRTSFEKLASIRDYEDVLFEILTDNN